MRSFDIELNSSGTASSLMSFNKPPRQRSGDVDISFIINL